MKYLLLVFIIFLYEYSYSQKNIENEIYSLNIYKKDKKIHRIIRKKKPSFVNNYYLFPVFNVIVDTSLNDHIYNKLRLYTFKDNNNPFMIYAIPNDTIFNDPIACMWYDGKIGTYNIIPSPDDFIVQLQKKYKCDYIFQVVDNIKNYHRDRNVHLIIKFNNHWYNVYLNDHIGEILYGDEDLSLEANMKLDLIE